MKLCFYKLLKMIKSASKLGRLVMTLLVTGLLIVNLFFASFLPSNVNATNGSVRRPGVQVGDWAKYRDVITSYQPPYGYTMISFLNVTSVVGTTVTFEGWTEFNGTRGVFTFFVDVVTGPDLTKTASFWVVAANLSPGDSFYEYGFYSKENIYRLLMSYLKIQETINASYAGFKREVNTWTAPWPLSAHYGFWTFLAWDKETGIQVESEFVTIDEVDKVTTSRITLVETNMWRIPVLLVHGIYSSSKIWEEGLIQALEQHGYELGKTIFTINLPPSPITNAVNDDIKYYAWLLSVKINQIKAITGKSKVDIVAHSMGGLVARYYMEIGGGAGSVNKLIMMGTPNHGSELLYPKYRWIWMLLLGLVEKFLNDAEEQMTPNSDFLNALGYSGKSNYYTIAGTDGLPITSLILPGKDDGVVSAESVQLAGVTLETFHVHHLTCYLLGPSYYNDLNTINRVIQILNDDPITERQSLTFTSAQISQEQQIPMEAPMISDKISPGQQKSHEIPISATTEVTFALAWLRGDLNLTLTSPNGTIIGPSAAQTDPNVTYYQNESITIEGYNIKNPQTGIWKVNVTPANISAEENYVIYTFLNTSLTLTLSPQKYQYAPNEPINIKANLTYGGEAITGATVTAKIQRPDSTTENILLYDDGAHNDNQTNDGIYANTYTNTAAWGSHGITVTAQGTINGEQFARETFTQVWVELHPDLTLDASDIHFSNENPSADEKTTITATIHNTGEAYANNATILFYDGNPAINGTLMGQETINVTPGGTKNASIKWTATLGTHEIYVLISPYNTFLETNYTNNMAYKSVSVTEDTIPPITTISLNGSLGNNEWFTSDVTATLSATDNVQVNKTEYSFDNATWTTYTMPFTITNEGNTSIYYKSTDKAGNPETIKTKTIKIDKTTPSANAGQDQTVNIGATVNFDASGSTDNMGIVSYEWNFGDGSTGTGVTTTHTYANTGTYTATLTIKDAAGNTATDSITITLRSTAFPIWIIGVTIAAIGIIIATTILWKKRKP